MDAYDNSFRYVGMCLNLIQLILLSSLLSSLNGEWGGGGGRVVGRVADVFLTGPVE